MNRIIFHVDVNSAYLSWTSVENLRTGSGSDLRDIPAVISGDERCRRGVVLAKSIPAKAFGIRTGEPVMSARKKYHSPSKPSVVFRVQPPAYGLPALPDS